MTEITAFEAKVDQAELGAVPWWRQRLFTAKGWEYRIVALADLAPDEVTA